MNRFFSQHAFKIILVAVFLLPFLTRGARKTLSHHDNRVEDWLPAEYQETQDLKWFKQRFENETFVLISWDGCDLADERLELLARKLVPPPDSAPVDDSTAAPLVPQTSPPGIAPPALAAPPARSAPLFKKVETGQRLMRRLTEPPLSLSEDEALRRLRGLFVGPAVAKNESNDRTQACAVITLTEAGKRDLRKTLGVIERVCQGELALPHERIRMGGPPVDNVAISTEGEKTLFLLLGPAGVVGVALAFWCLRSVRLTTMVFLAALYVAGVSLAVVYWSGGTMNAILMTMPAVVYVAGISGAIHFANYYRDAAVEGGIEGAPARAVKHAWLPCTLSAGTSAAGLISLYTSELVPIKLFGVYTAIGVLATLALLFLFLPAWMQLWPMKPHSLLDGDAPRAEDVALPKRWRRILEGVVDRRRLVFAGLLAVMIVCGCGLTKINTSIKLTKLFSPHAEILKNYAWLEEKLGPLVPMEIVVSFDNSRCKLNTLERMQLIGRVQDRLVEIRGIGNTMSAVTFAPSLAVKRAGPFISKRVMAGILNKKLDDHRDEYIESGFLAVEGEREMWRISARVRALNDIDYGEFVRDIQRQVTPVLEAQRQELAAAVAIKAKSDRAASPATEPLAGASPTPAASAGDTQGITAIYTGLVPVVYKAQRAMLDGLAWNFITDLLTVAAVITVVFGDLSAGLLLLAPSVFPVVVVFGLMGWMGVLIDVGTIMTPTVALGVSVDDIVHFFIWYRRGLAEGRSRKGAVMLAYEGCARAMYQSWSVLGLGLAVFALSSFVPTQRFGAMMFCLLTAALVGNLLLMPTVLAGPLAYFFGRRLIRRAQRNRPNREEPHRQIHGPEFAERGPIVPVRRETPRRSIGA